MHDFPAPALVYGDIVSIVKKLTSGTTRVCRLFPKYDYNKIYADCEPFHGEV